MKDEHETYIIYQDEKYSPPWWLGVYFLAVFLGVLFACWEAFAVPLKRVEVNVVHGVAPISATREEAASIFRSAIKQIRRELNVRIIARKWRTIKQENYDYFNSDPIDVFDRIRLDAQRGAYALRYPTVFLSAPAMIGNRPVLFGATDGYECQNMQWIHAGAAIMPDKPRESVIVVAHEIGHLLGADHTFNETDSVMAWNALDLSGDLRFTEVSKKEIRRCLRNK